MTQTQSPEPKPTTPATVRDGARAMISRAKLEWTILLGSLVTLVAAPSRLAYVALLVALAAYVAIGARLTMGLIDRAFPRAEPEPEPRDPRGGTWPFMAGQDVPGYEPIGLRRVPLAGPSGEIEWWMVYTDALPLIAGLAETPGEALARWLAEYEALRTTGLAPSLPGANDE